MSTGLMLRPCGFGSGAAEDSGGSRLKTSSSESLAGESLLDESPARESLAAFIEETESFLRLRALMKAGRRLIARHVSRPACGSQSARTADVARWTTGEHDPEKRVSIFGSDHAQSDSGWNVMPEYRSAAGGH